MEELIELYGDVLVGVISVIMSIAFIGICMALYRIGIEGLLDSIMYG